jgi:hypothetical protein
MRSRATRATRGSRQSKFARLYFFILIRAIVVMAAQRLGRLLLLGLALGCVAATSQSSIFDSDPARTPVQKDATSTAPIFETTGSDPYTHITHAAYPNHHVRIKKSRFCDETVE